MVQRACGSDPIGWEPHTGMGMADAAPATVGTSCGRSRGERRETRRTGEDLFAFER